MHFESFYLPSTRKPKITKTKIIRIGTLMFLILVILSSHFYTSQFLNNFDHYLSLCYFFNYIHFDDVLHKLA